MEINEIQRDLIIGSLLGDGCIQKGSAHYRISFWQSDKQLEYLKAKLNVLKNICTKDEVSLKKKSEKTPDRTDIYYFFTKSFDLIDQFKELNNIDLLNELNENSLLIWLLDDGSLERNNRYTIGAKRFNEEELIHTQKIFIEKFGIEPKIKYYKKDKLKANGFRFNVPETKRLNELLKNSEFYDFGKKTIPYKFIN